MTTLPKPVGLLLRLNAKSFEPINALRAQYPAVKLARQKADPQRILLPYLSLLHMLPGTLLPTIQERLSKIASLRKPFTLKVGAARLTDERRMGKARKGSPPPTYGFGFELPAEEIEQLRRELYEEFSADIKAVAPEQFLTAFKFRPRTNLALPIRHCNEGLPKEQASEVLKELEKQYPNGFGTIAAEGFALQEHVRFSVMRVTENGMRGEYSFGGN